LGERKVGGMNVAGGSSEGLERPSSLAGGGGPGVVKGCLARSDRETRQGRHRRLLVVGPQWGGKENGESKERRSIKTRGEKKT